VNLRRSELLDAQTSEPLAHVDAGLKRLALEDTSQETTGEGVTSTVGVVDLLRLNGVDGELLDVVLTLDSNQCRVGALGDDGDSLSLLVLLREVGKMLGNVLGLLAGEIVGLGVSGGLGLIANDVVPVRGARMKGAESERTKGLLFLAACLASSIMAGGQTNIGQLRKVSNAS
jgi:hypothetical protein